MGTQSYCTYLVGGPQIRRLEKHSEIYYSRRISIIGVEPAVFQCATDDDKAKNARTIPLVLRVKGLYDFTGALRTFCRSAPWRRFVGWRGGRVLIGPAVHYVGDGGVFEPLHCLRVTRMICGFNVGTRKLASILHRMADRLRGVQSRPPRQGDERNEVQACALSLKSQRRRPSLHARSYGVPPK